MKLVSPVAVIVVAMSVLVCFSCAEESGEKLEKEFRSGKFDQEKSLAALESNVEYTRQVAAEWLAKLGNKKVEKPLIRHMHTDESDIVRKICLNGLMVRFSEAKDNSIVPEFIKALEQKDNNLRQKAAFALGQVRSDDGYKALLGMFKDTAPEVRVEAIKAIGKFGKTEALAELAKLYEDEVSVRRVAVDTIAEIGGPDAIDLLIPALGNSDFAVKKTAVEKLGEMKARKAAPHIIPVLKANNSSLRIAAAKALGTMRDRSAIPALIDLLTDPNFEVRREVVDALGKIGGIEQLDKLIALLDDSDSGVRELALDALVKMKVQGNDALKAKLHFMATQEPNTFLREKAKQVLEQMK